MNSAKKTLKEQGLNVNKDKKKGEVKPKGARTKVILAIAVAIFGILSVFIGYEQLHRPMIVKVNDSKVYLDEMMYYIYASEAQGSYYSQLVGGLDSYWNMDAGDGQTMREAAKNEVLQTATKYEVLYNEAVKADYKVTDEDKKSASTEAESIMGQLTDSQKQETGFTQENLTEVLTKKAVADRYTQDIIDGFDIDDDAIKAGVSFDEYRQYDVQLYRIPTSKTDEEGNSTAMTDAEKKEAYDKLAAVLSKAKTAEDFTKLIGEDEKEITFTEDSNFTATGDWTYGDEAKEQVIKMENDQISDIIETDNAYIFVKMVNNNSSESYDSAVESAISDEETERFDEYYNDLVKEYKIKENTSEWKKVDFGNVTID